MWADVSLMSLSHGRSRPYHEINWKHLKYNKEKKRMIEKKGIIVLETQIIDNNDRKY